MAFSTSISKFQLTDFRNYGSISLVFDPGAIVLFGANGAGKTNLLEAISLLSPGRGLRRATYGDIARHGTSGFSLHALVDTPAGEVAIGTGTVRSAPDQTEVQRLLRINGTAARSGEELLDHARVLWLTPSMDMLFTGPASERRRFVDRLVLAIDPGHARRALDYEKAMRGRNRLLSEPAPDPKWLDAIEARMAETGTAIAVARYELVKLLAGLAGSMADTEAFPRADLGMVGHLEEQARSRPAIDVEEAFRDLLRQGRARDAVAGRTLDGPHRSDLSVRYRAKAMPAEFCSTGEQKALLIGLVLGHARLTAQVSGMVPILLLDEIAAHLDHDRRRSLFAILEDIGCQTFMTGTERSLFEAIAGRAQFLHITDGTAAAA